MRLFTALDLSQEVLLRLERLTCALRPEAHINWSPLDNLHITTKFIGEWPEARLDDLTLALDKLTVRQPFEVEVKDLGWFPNERAPRVFWIGVHAGEHLAQLAKDTEERLRGLGVKPEDRAYSPHLTLARIKGAVPLTRLREIVREMQPPRPVNSWPLAFVYSGAIPDPMPASIASFTNSRSNQPLPRQLRNI